MEHALTLNTFNFNGAHYLQIRGCAMGTIAAPSYATILMGKFEETHIYPIIGSDCVFYARYIDDIFFVYTGSDDKLTQFLMTLNTVHDSIMFDYEKSTTSVTFLDTRIYIDENRKLQTTLHTKITDTHNYLHFKSSHPKHLKENLPYSQALRLRRICSNNEELNKHIENLEHQFTTRGYKQHLIREQINKAISTPREDTLIYKIKNKSSRMPLVTTFNPTLPPLSQIIKRRWEILHLKPDQKNCLRNPAFWHIVDLRT